MQEMLEPELKYAQMYNVMPPHPDFQKEFKVLNNDINTFHGEEKIQKSWIVLLRLIKTHNYDPVSQEF